MTERFALGFAGKRLFMFFLKVYFPEYLSQHLRANEYPFAEERMQASFSLTAYILKRPFSVRVGVISLLLDIRETEYLRLGRTPRPPLDEVNDILREAEACMNGKGSNIIPFPLVSR